MPLAGSVTKIELGLGRPTTLAWQNEASGMEDSPVAREVMAFECGEDLAPESGVSASGRGGASGARVLYTAG